MEQETLHVSSCLQTKGTYAEVQKLIRILIPSNFFQELAPSATLPIFDLFRLREEWQAETHRDIPNLLSQRKSGHLGGCAEAALTPVDSWDTSEVETDDVWRVVAAVFWPNTMKSHWLNYFTSEQMMARTAQSENKSSRVLSIGVINDENEYWHHLWQSNSD